MKTTYAYGSWPSPISTDMVIKGSPKLQETSIENGRIFWLQTLPEEKGRVTIMSYDGGQIQSILPRPLSAKSKVHEYGGGSYLIDGKRVYFVLADDQRVYAADIESDGATKRISFSPFALIPEHDERQLRFADLCLDRTRERLIAVCEEHRNGNREPKNYLASIPLDGSYGPTPLIEGSDFYASPKISPCGEWLCWLSWNHPDMPWDASQLWLASINDDGRLGKPKLIAGNGSESVFQPQWSPDGTLYFVSDRDNWWNIYRCNISDMEIEQATALEAEFATPQWTFNMSTYAFLNAQTVIATYNQQGQWYLCTIDVSHRAKPLLKKINLDISSIYGISAAEGRAAFIGASEESLPAVYRFDGNDCVAVNPLTLSINSGDISRPRSFIFPTTDNQKAYGYFYPPASAHYQGESGLPPLIVTCHGGPTGATENNLDLKVQYWTSRGFAVLDVNYRGSTGYGRQYRQLLYKNWGVYDVDDVCAAAEYAVAQGWADPDRLIIKGSSAGGYTVLAALTFRRVFKVGVSLYGIGDLDTLVRDTHKFEAKYLDKLVGDHEREHEIYAQRSPVNYTEKLNCPLLIFQGLDDKVVPPNQAIKMVEAVKKKGLPVAYVEYADEAHGFRNSRNISHMLKAEQYFYARIFGFPLPGELKNFIPIFNL